jgi:hypothetical protein
MATNVIWEIRADGSDTNGGGYDIIEADYATVDYSQQAAPVLTVTDAACAGTTALSSATGGFTLNMIGNVVYLSSGPGRYVITAVADTNNATLDRAGPTATGMTANVGGALASIGQLGAILADATHWALSATAAQSWINSAGGTITLTGTTANVAGGPINMATGSVAAKVYRLIGYGGNRTLWDGTAPTIFCNDQAPAEVIKMGGTTSAAQYCYNITVDANDQSSVDAFSGGIIYNFTIRCTAIDADYGFRSVEAMQCRATGCAAGVSGGTHSAGNTVDDCTIGIAVANLSACIASNCGTGFSNNSLSADNCVAYNCTTVGFTIGNPVRSGVLVNCMAYDCGYSYTGCENSTLINCASGNATSGVYDSGGTPAIAIGEITLTADPFTNAASGDFSLNTTAGGGALLRAAGLSPFGQTGYPDIGAVQHADPHASALGLTAGILKDGEVVDDVTGTYDPTAAAVYPAAADVWHDTGAYGPTGSDYTPAMVGSDIANLEAGNIKKDVVIDDVTGSYDGAGGGGGPLVGASALVSC